MLGGRYRLVAPVGVGTSSRVYLGVDSQLKRQVAVKVLHEALADDDAFLRRFRAEARAAGALNHPNILAVFDWGEDRHDTPDGVTTVPFLVTEYLSGGTVRSMLDEGITLSPSQTPRDRPGGVEGAGPRPSTRAGPSRCETRQPALRRRRSVAPGGLRSGPSPGGGIMDRAGRIAGRNGEVLLAGGGPGSSTRRPVRRVQPRSGAGRVPDRHGARHRRHRCRDAVVAGPGRHRTGPDDRSTALVARTGAAGRRRRSARCRRVRDLADGRCRVASPARGTPARPHPQRGR